MKKNEQNKLIGSYAEALYKVSESSGVADEVLSSAESMYNELKQDARVAEYLSSPMWNNEAKRNALIAIASDKRLPQPLVGLFNTLAVNGRSGLLIEVLDKFKYVYYSHKNITPVKVKTAIELSETQKHNLIAAMEKYTSGKVVVDYAVCPDILGGMLVECGSKQIDDTIRGKLNRLELLMKGTL